MCIRDRFKPEVELTMDLGGTKVALAGADWTAFGFDPSVEVRSAGPGFNFGFRIRGTFTSDTDFSEESLDAVGECSGFALNGYAGWGFALGERWSLSLVAGFAYRSYDAGFVTESIPVLGDIKYDVSTSAATFDLGLRLRGRFGERVTWTTSLMGGPIISGELEATTEFFIFHYSATEDVEGGGWFEFRTGLDVEVAEGLSFNVGFVFEVFGVDVDVDEDDELDGFAYQKVAASLGLTWKF